MSKRCKNCCLFQTDACRYQFYTSENDLPCRQFIEEAEEITIKYAHTASQACVNCIYDKRTETGQGIECRCEKDNHIIGYTACFEQTCEKFKRTTKFDKRSKNK